MNMAQVSVAGMLLIPIWLFVFVGIIAALGGRSSYDVRVTPANLLLGALIALVVVPVLHEVVHGLLAVVFRARPAFGIGPGFAYTTFREPMTRWPYLAVGLGPLVVLSVAFVALAVAWPSAGGYLLLAAVVNSAGAIGDLWMAWRILRLPRNALFYDLADGFAALVPE
jgi:hypothetical protein